jgi:Protein of unknown function (DUF3618)
MTERTHERSDPASGDGRPHPNGRQQTATERVAALRAEIEHTRADLGETVQALAAKADVKARMRNGVHEMSDRGRELAVRFGDSVRRRPVPIVAAVGAAIAILALLRWRRNR